MRKSQEFFIVFSPRAGVLQFCELCKLGLTWMFLLIFWGKGLLCWFSGVVSLAVLHCPCQGGRAESYAPDCSMWLLFPEGFPHHFRGWEWKCEPPSVQPWSWMLAPSTLQCALTEKLSNTFVSLVSVCTLCTPSLWPRIFISAPPPSLEFPNFVASCGMHSHRSSRGWEGGLDLVLPLVGPPLWEQSPNPWQFVVYGNTQLKAPFSAHWLQPASLLRCLGTLPHSDSHVLSVIPGILSPGCPT